MNSVDRQEVGRLDMSPHVTLFLTLQSSILRTAVFFYDMIKQYDDCSVLAYQDFVEREGHNMALKCAQVCRKHGGAVGYAAIRGSYMGQTEEGVTRASSMNNT